MFKEEWLRPRAVIPVNIETTSALVAELKRVVGIVGSMALAQQQDYERGFIDGMQKQMQSSVDRAVNATAKQPAQQELVAWASDVLFDNDTEIIPASDKGKLGTGSLTVALYIKGETT